MARTNWDAEANKHTAIVRQIVNRMHVGQPDEDVDELLRSKLKSGKADESLVKAIVRLGKKIHHENQKLYGRVMGNPRASKRKSDGRCVVCGATSPGKGCVYAKEYWHRQDTKAWRLREEGRDIFGHKTRENPGALKNIPEWALGAAGGAIAGAWAGSKVRGGYERVRGAVRGAAASLKAKVGMNPKHIDYSKEALPFPQTRLTTWFERDRAHVDLQDANGNTLIEWWDDDVRQAADDGFLKMGRGTQALHKSAYDYWIEIGAPRSRKKPRR
jgi:hypothetical protein